MSLGSALLALLSTWTLLSSGSRADVNGTGPTWPRPPDAVTEHMRMLYSRSNRGGFAFRDGNTVRSFQAHWGSVHQRRLLLFNLTSLTRSEDVLSATLHLSSAGCSGPGPCTPHGAEVRVVLSSFGSVDPRLRTLGHFRVNVSTAGQVSWQWTDVTALVNRAKRQDRLIISMEAGGRGFLWERPPYVLVYANDSAISEPESVVSTLRRRPAQGGPAPGGPAPGGPAPGGPAPGAPASAASARNGTSRRRRSVDVLLPLQNNELPGPEYPYQPFHDKPGRRTRKKTRKSQRHKMALLRFDEQTVERARQKQLAPPRSCARRYLKVDFADIGWSEWIISPKAFDAFYCAGSCQFPMAKALKPSNHATIQSIVRAVGVVSGVPEPCCVPERMSSLSILFFDQDRNVVLKVYPNMTVESCACR